MRVYVVGSWWCQETTVLGVFSSQEKADAFVAKQPAWKGYDYKVMAVNLDDESAGMEW